jgi:hypothetical protein
VSTQTTTRIYTRTEYVREKTISHHDYYAQFVTDATLRHVRAAFDVETLCDAFARDKHLNTISIRKWDRLAIRELDVDQPWIGLRSSGPFAAAIPFDRGAVREAGDFISRADLICIAKCAARILIEQHPTDNDRDSVLVGQENRA